MLIHGGRSCTGPLSFSCLEWSERQDFHLRPPGPRPGTLKTELRSDEIGALDGTRTHSSRRQRVAFLFSYESEMVGSAGNAPVRHFRLCFVTPDLQSGSRITSLGGPAQAVVAGVGVTPT